MSASDVVSYKYAFPEPLKPETRNYLVALGIFVFIAALFFLSDGKWFVPLLVFLIFGLVQSGIFGAARQLELYPRYLLCGSQVVYFQSVKEARLMAESGELVLTYDNGRGLRQFKLERDRFPTGARKEHKILANKDKKFRKVAGKIIAAVQQQAPEAVVKA